MGAKGTPSQTRTGDAAWVARLGFTALQGKLPLRWPTPPNTPGCPKRRLRSHYVYRGWEDLQEPATWQTLTQFRLLLRLVDFGPLRPVLAQLMGWKNDRGYRPFDPVSIFLLKLWQISNRWNRSQVIANLRQPEYAEVVSQMGFEGSYPTEGGLRYIETCLGWHSEVEGGMVEVENEEGQSIQVAVQRLNELIVQSIGLLHQAGLITPELWRRALLCPDGMLHESASRMHCASATVDCYEMAPRHCAAREKGKRGCDCAERACYSTCRFATPRDPEARFIWYSGSNKRPHNPNQPADPTREKPARGKGLFGYRSLALQLSDPQHRFNLTLLADFLPANLPELPFATAQLLQLGRYYPGLKAEWVAGDAAFGFETFLHAVYETLRARRLVDLRAHNSDQNKARWPSRGYDDQGRPICPFGYALSSNGFDSEHRRHKWICEQACQKGISPQVELPETVYPPPECPYQDPKHRHGKVLNVAERFADGSMRLVRDVPVGSPTWKRFYYQARNASEARNAFHENLGLKRMPIYGLLRGKTTVFLADVWRNLSTLARLVREATLAEDG